MASTTFLAAQLPDATTINAAFPKGIIYRAKRSAAESGITTENGTIRLDNVSVVSGRAYRITTGTGQYFSTVNEAAQITLFFHVNTAGTATTGSPSLAVGRIVTQAGTGGGAGELEFHYYAASNQTLSILLSVARTVGTGTVTAAGPDGLGAEIVVEDLGFTVSNTGTDV